MRRYILSLSLAAACAACRGAPVVRTATVAKRSVEATINGVNSGTVRAEQSADLAFGAVGRVQDVRVKLGDIIEKDALIAAIENADLKVTLIRAEAELRRRQGLAKGAIAETEYDVMRQNVEAARTALEKTLIKAPYRGIIAELNLDIGQLSQITAIIPKAPVRIIDVVPRFVRVEMDEADLPRLKLGQAARIKILAVRHEPFEGRVRKIVPFVSSVREQDRTAEIELDVDSPAFLPVGASADVELIVDRRDDVPAVVSRAVLGRGAERYVFLLDGDRVRKRTVKVGLSNYEATEITDGLRVDDVVAIPDDVAELGDGTKVTKKGR